MEVEGLGRGRDFTLWPSGGGEWDWRETDMHHEPGIRPVDVQGLLDHGCEAVVLSQGGGGGGGGGFRRGAPYGAGDADFSATAGCGRRYCEDGRRGGDLQSACGRRETRRGVVSLDLLRGCFTNEDGYHILW